MLLVDTCNKKTDWGGGSRMDVTETDNTKIMRKNRRELIQIMVQQTALLSLV
jgi:hypothetical protein